MDRLFIMDLMPFLYKGHFAFFRNPRITSTGVNTSALIGLASGIVSVVKNGRADRFVLAMDPGGPTFRHEAYPQYKAQREKMPEDIADSIPRAYELADALGIKIVSKEGFEADDVMGSLAAKGCEAGFDVYMVTPDKDAAQLVRPGVKLYRPGRAGEAAEIYDEAKVCEHWRIPSPASMIDYLALAGDASDNIPGVKGVGEKTAVELLQAYGSLDGILARASEIKGKLGEKIVSGAEDAKMSRFLAKIRTDVPVEVDWDSLKLGAPDAEKLSAFCAKYEMRRFAKEFGIDIDEAPAAAGEEGAGGAALATIADTPHEYSLVDTEEGAKALFEELSRFGTIAFDTETAPSDDGHDSTDAHYCKLVGFSFAVAPGRAWYVDGPLVDFFRPLFADPSKTFVAHNVKFDRTVLARYGIGFASTPKDTMLAHYCIDAAARHNLDTLSGKYLSYRPIPIEKLIGEKKRGEKQLPMSALKPAEILDYAAEDADVAFRLYGALSREVSEKGVGRALAEAEEPLVKILIDMEREGVKIDVGALKEYGRELDAEIMEKLRAIYAYSSPGFNPDSPKQLSAMLFEELGLPAGGVKKTSSGQYTTDEKTLSRLVGAHPVVQDILEYRACAKRKSTYVDKLPQLIDAEGRVHTTFSQSFTETGRLSSSNPNLQNIPVRTERGKMIRRSFVARDENHLLVSADYSQIELRLMAAFSGDEAMMSAFRRGEDIHRDTASRIYGVGPEAVTKEQRGNCKMVNFGIIYGISAFGLSQRLKIPRKEAADLIESYFALYPKVKEYMSKAISSAREKGYAETILGRRRTLRDINSRNATARQAAERDAINTPIQGSAADLVKVAMVKVDRALKERRMRSKMVLQIHDELLFDAPKEEAEELMALAKREMEAALDFGVPLEVGVGAGPDWLSAH